MSMIIPAGWTVPAVLVSRIGDTAGRQRAMTAEGHLLLIVHQPPDPKDGSRLARLFWRDPQGNWKSRSSGDGSQAVKRHLAEYTERVEALESLWQEARSAAEFYQLLREIAPVHRSARNLHTTLQQAREMVPDDRDLINLRDQAGEIERSLEILHNDARNGLDFMVAHQGEQQSRRMYEMASSAHRLNLLAALCFPIATLAAVFGMNANHGLEIAGHQLFWIIVAGGLLAGLVIAQVIARKPEPIAAPSTKKKIRRR